MNETDKQLKKNKIKCKLKGLPKNVKCKMSTNSKILNQSSSKSSGQSIGACDKCKSKQVKVCQKEICKIKNSIDDDVIDVISLEQSNDLTTVCEKPKSPELGSIRPPLIPIGFDLIMLDYMKNCEQMSSFKTNKMCDDTCLNIINKEPEYLQFALRITEDIIRNNIRKTHEIRQVIRSHMEANKGRLSKDKMKKQIESLILDLELNLNNDENFEAVFHTDDTFYSPAKYSKVKQHETDENYKLNSSDTLSLKYDYGLKNHVSEIPIKKDLSLAKKRGFEHLNNSFNNLFGSDEMESMSSLHTDDDSIHVDEGEDGFGPHYDIQANLSSRTRYLKDNVLLPVIEESVAELSDLSLEQNNVTHVKSNDKELTLLNDDWDALLNHICEKVIDRVYNITANTETVPDCKKKETPLLGETKTHNPNTEMANTSINNEKSRRALNNQPEDNIELTSTFRRRSPTECECGAICFETVSSAFMDTDNDLSTQSSTDYVKNLDNNGLENPSESVDERDTMKRMDKQIIKICEQVIQEILHSSSDLYTSTDLIRKLISKTLKSKKFSNLLFENVEFPLRPNCPCNGILQRISNINDFSIDELTQDSIMSIKTLESPHESSSSAIETFESDFKPPTRDVSLQITTHISKKDVQTLTKTTPFTENDHKELIRKEYVKNCGTNTGYQLSYDSSGVIPVKDRVKIGQRVIRSCASLETKSNNSLNRQAHFKQSPAENERRVSIAHQVVEIFEPSTSTDTNYTLKQSSDDPSELGKLSVKMSTRSSGICNPFSETDGRSNLKSILETHTDPYVSSNVDDTSLNIKNATSDPDLANLDRIPTLSSSPSMEMAVHLVQRNLERFRHDGLSSTGSDKINKEITKIDSPPINTNSVTDVSGTRAQKIFYNPKRSIKKYEKFDKSDYQLERETASPCSTSHLSTFELDDEKISPDRRRSIRFEQPTLDMDSKNRLSSTELDSIDDSSEIPLDTITDESLSSRSHQTSLETFKQLLRAYRDSSIYGEKNQKSKM